MSVVCSDVYQVQFYANHRWNDNLMVPLKSEREARELYSQRKKVYADTSWRLLRLSVETHQTVTRTEEIASTVAAKDLLTL